MTKSDDLQKAENRARVRQERNLLKEQHGAFFTKVSELMFMHDPIGINFTDNTDEYDAEAGTVIPRLATCRNVEDLLSVLHEEFCRWFGPDTAGPLSVYEPLARDIWSHALSVGWPTAASEA
jgi:hypothetical protein